jgi:hypothetical protein
MLWVLDRRLFEHGGGLRALAHAAQRLRVVDRRLGVGRVGAVAIAPGLRRALPIGVALRRRSDAERSGRGMGGVAACRQKRERGCERDPPKQAGERVGTKTAHHGLEGPHATRHGKS